MLAFFYRFVTPWAKASRVQIFFNRIIGAIVNLIYPIYCVVVPINTKRNKNIQKNLIISLTSYPDRINKIHLCINSLLRQKYKASRVILWLADSQFRKKEDLPKKLLKLEKKGLEIKFCEDLKSYKKIIYSAKEYSDNIIITADDDTLYPEFWTDGLLKEYQKFPDCVVCYRAHEITFDKSGNVNIYSKWKHLSPDTKGPSTNLVAIGVGGILYPEYFFKNVNFDYKVIKKICPTADDLWLKAITLINGYKVVKVNKNSKEWFTIRQTQNTKLTTENVEKDNKNDIAMAKLIRYYNMKFEE